MTQKQARARARKLWGKQADALERQTRDPNSPIRCRVGKWVLMAGIAAGFFVKGEGSTWEAAFAEAAKDDARLKALASR